MNWSHLAQDSDQWRVAVNTVTTLVAFLDCVSDYRLPKEQSVSWSWSGTFEGETCYMWTYRHYPLLYVNLIHLVERAHIT